MSTNDLEGRLGLQLTRIGVDHLDGDIPALEKALEEHPDPRLRRLAHLIEMLIHDYRLVFAEAEAGGLATADLRLAERAVRGYRTALEALGEEAQRVVRNGYRAEPRPDAVGDE